jgi:hypothetical protein
MGNQPRVLLLHYRPISTATAAEDEFAPGFIDGCGNF